MLPSQTQGAETFHLTESRFLPSFAEFGSEEEFGGKGFAHTPRFFGWNHIILTNKKINSDFSKGNIPALFSQT
ncbi:MAG: hypothetical protein ACJAVK_000471 [Akkermansiaceae bacterium]